MRRILIFSVIMLMVCLTGCVHILPDDESDPSVWKASGQFTDSIPEVTKPTIPAGTGGEADTSGAPEKETGTPEKETDRNGFPNEPEDGYTKRY